MLLDPDVPSHPGISESLISFGFGSVSGSMEGCCFENLARFLPLRREDLLGTGSPGSGTLSTAMWL